MIKYWGDIVEKLTAGALIIGLFQKEGDLRLSGLGLLLVVLWAILRRVEIRARRIETWK